MRISPACLLSFSIAAPPPGRFKKLWLIRNWLQKWRAAWRANSGFPPHALPACDEHTKAFQWLLRIPDAPVLRAYGKDARAARCALVHAVGSRSRPACQVTSILRR